MVYNIGHSHLTHKGPKPAPNDNDEAIYAAINERACCDPVQPIMKEAPVDEKPVAAAPKPEEKPVTIAVKPESSVSILLFKTPSCPNCKAAGAILDKAGVEYQPLNANEERELVQKFGIKQAPTLVLVNGDSFEKYRGVSDIKGWLMHK